LTPKGISISKKGISPDIEVKLTDEQMNDMSSYSGINILKDIQLKKAVEELNKIIQ
jgi:C-terminal processing protease CtpA/Prc